MLNKNVKNGHPCLVPDFRRKVFSFLPLTMILAVDLSYCAFIMLMYFLSIQFAEKIFWQIDESINKFIYLFLWLKSFIMKRCWILSNAFSPSTEMIIGFLFFTLLMRFIILTDLLMLNHLYIPWISPTSSNISLASAMCSELW